MTVFLRFPEWTHTYLVEIEKMDIDVLKEMNAMIKKEKQDWIEEVESYWDEIEDNDW